MKKSAKAVKQRRDSCNAKLRRALSEIRSAKDVAPKSRWSVLHRVESEIAFAMGTRSAVSHAKTKKGGKK